MKIASYCSIVAFLIILLLNSSCKKIVEVDPPINAIIDKEIYNSSAGAASVLTGIYTDMSANEGFTGSNSISLRTGLSADELVAITEPNDIMTILYTNSLTNNGSQLFWTILYSYVFRCNSAIEGISNSTKITAPVKAQLIGEAKFLRAFMYFYLVNLYGDVPLVTTTDINTNSKAPRVASQEVYAQIIADLKEAQNILRNEYVSANVTDATEERTRPNKAAATALLARVYLYLGNWVEAENEATQIVDDIRYQLEDLDNTFLLNSREAIWQLQPVNAGLNTSDARIFVLAEGDNIPAGPDGFSFGRPVYMSNILFNAFEENDNRKLRWIDSVSVSGVTYPYAFKYKSWLFNQPTTEYLMVLRLAELYLIRAEARAHQGKVLGANTAESDLNIIRLRAGLQATTADDQSTMLEAIYNERRVELFTEWGHRWLDLKRLNKIDEVMSEVAPQKGGTWATYKSLYPIPIFDISTNPNLKGHQNPGYPEL